MKTTDLSTIAEQYGKEIYGFCRRLARNQADADDLYQETFLKAMEICDRIDDEQNPKAFLISIAIGVWKNGRRKFAWRQRIAPTEGFEEDMSNSSALQADETPEDMVITKELRKLVQSAAESLSDKLRIPLYMYYTANLSVEQIASALKIPQGTVKSRLYKARREMKNRLEVNHYEEF